MFSGFICQKPGTRGRYKVQDADFKIIEIDNTYSFSVTVWISREYIAI